MQISTETETFVVHFGEMASRWGFNRTVGQMLALMVLSEKPLNADDIAAALRVSRGNVSMAAKELQSWQLIKVHREPGDRKDYLMANGSIWELAQRVMSERRKREVDPTLSVVRGLLMDIDEDSHARAQIQEMHDLLELFTKWFDDVQSMKPEHLKALMKMGAGVGRVLEMTNRLKPGKSGEDA
jgi:DNA-binding transcriptional regulator GbsR (MarR family)